MYVFIVLLLFKYLRFIILFSQIFCLQNIIGNIDSQRISVKTKSRKSSDCTYNRETDWNRSENYVKFM